MKLESGFKKIRIAKHGVNQERVNRFLQWVQNEGFIVWDLEGDTRYEIDGIDEASQERVQRYLESLGRTFKQPGQKPRLLIICKRPQCSNESEYGSIYCTSCNQQIHAQNVARQQAEAYWNPCLHRGCASKARRHSRFCFDHRHDRSW
jgi:hypothetical protein